MSELNVPVTPVYLPNEVSAIEALQAKISDSQGPTLNVTAALKTHLQSYPQTQKQLAEKLKMQPSALSQMLKLLDLSETAQQNLEGMVLAYKDIQTLVGPIPNALKEELCRALKGGQIQPGALKAEAAGRMAKRENNVGNAGESTNGPQNNELNAGEFSKPMENSPKLENNEENAGESIKKLENTQENAGEFEENGDTGGPTVEDPISGIEVLPAGQEEDYPLMRDTANFWARSFLFWDHDSHPKVEAGALFVAWINAAGRFIRKRWFWIPMLGTVLALTLDGGWHVKKDVRAWAARHWIGGGMSSLIARGVGLPAPEVSWVGYYPGHKFHITWNPVAPGMTYQVLAACDYDGRLSDGYFSILDKPVSTPGARVDELYGICPNPVALVVRTVAPDGNESARSNVIQVELTEDNKAATADPLPPEDAAAVASSAGLATAKTGQGSANENGSQRESRPTGGSAKGSLSKKENHSPVSTMADVPVGGPSRQPPSSHVNAGDVTQFIQTGIGSNYGLTGRLVGAAAGLAGKAASSGNATSVQPTLAAAGPSYPGPKNLQWKPIAGSRNIQLSWQDMGPGYHYNVYASYAGDVLKFDRDGYLLRAATTPWIPPANGLQVFVFYVTAVNPQGTESAPSPQMMADLR